MHDIRKIEKTVPQLERCTEEEVDAFHEALASLNNGEVTHQSFNDVTGQMSRVMLMVRDKHKGRKVESWRLEKLGEMMNHEKRTKGDILQSKLAGWNTTRFLRLAKYMCFRECVQSWMYFPLEVSCVGCVCAY